MVEAPIGFVLLGVLVIASFASSRDGDASRRGGVSLANGFNHFKAPTARDKDYLC